MHYSRQQWLVAGWLGPSITVRVRVRVRARECGSSFVFVFSVVLPFFSFFFPVLKYHDVKMITTWESQYNDLVS